jgi:bis(5'-nucleosyl)-tetraphosphatase (symmetrical)
VSRTIVIGDVHGCVDELQDLLNLLALVSDDRIVLLGDLIDRGPDPAGVVSLAKRIGAESVIGNHEEKALRWRKHETRRKLVPNYKNPMPPIHPDRLAEWAKIPEEHWAWIGNWPTHIHIDRQWTAIHAGCLPDISIEGQAVNDLMRLRYVKTTITGGITKHKMASILPDGSQPGSIPEAQVAHWTSLWSGPRSIVYGHYVWPAVNRTTNTLGLDTGCAFGGRLTAAIFDGRGISIESVPARRTYVTRIGAAVDD